MIMDEYWMIMDEDDNVYDITPCYIILRASKHAVGQWLVFD